MCSQSKGIGSADISASTSDKIRTIPAVASAAKPEAAARESTMQTMTGALNTC